MVQKSKKPPAAEDRRTRAAPKRRGRPRAYQPEVALGKALDLFRKDGFAATSLDDLSAATGMNRPSLYGAFGDKRELYIKSYQRYRERRPRGDDRHFPRANCRSANGCERIYAVALDIYLSGEAGPRGCFTVMTAASEAVSDPDIRAMVLEGFVELDKAFAGLFRLAKENGELPATADPRRAGATRLRHHPHHRHPRPRPGAAQGTGSDRQGRDRCDGRGEVAEPSPRAPANGGARHRMNLIPPLAIDDILQRAAGLEALDLRATYFEISSGSVSAALCGVSTTFGWVQNGLSAGSGSVA